MSATQYVRLKGDRYEHIVVAERALGKPLPCGAIVHHHNEDRADNRNANLVICPSRAYHNLLHIRMAALAASGNANWRRCHYCKQHDDLANLVVRQYEKKTRVHHADCIRAYSRKWSAINPGRSTRAYRKNAAARLSRHFTKEPSQ